MCGHGTIGVATALVEMGMVPVVKQPVTEIVMETPVGLIYVRVEVQDGVARRVTFGNQTAFLYRKDLEIEVQDLGRLKVDICYGGDWYAILPASDVGLAIKPEHASEILLKGN